MSKILKLTSLLTASTVATLITGCSSPNLKMSDRQPAGASEWTLQSITLHTEAINGTCDLTPSRLFHRSHTQSQTVFFEGLLHGRSGRNEGCQLTSNQFGPDATSAVISGNYMSQVPERMLVTIKIGDLLIVENHDDDRSLSARQYEDIDTIENGTVKFRADATTTLSAICAAPVAKGFWGFGSRRVLCTFTNGAGSISLIEEN